MEIEAAPVLCFNIKKHFHPCAFLWSLRHASSPLCYMKPVHRFGEAVAGQVIAAMQAEVARRGLSCVLAVGDRHGELLAFLRMDDAVLSSINVAINKMVTAARVGAATGHIGAESRNPAAPFDMAYFGDPRIVGWPGGLPVRFDGEIVGAVAVSGLAEALDEEIAQLGVSVILEAMQANSKAWAE